MSKNEDNLTRIYNINLGKCWDTPKYRRTDRVINMIKEFAMRNMDSQRIKIDQDLNRFIWSRGKTNPPRKVRVRMIKDEDDMVIVSSYTESKQITTGEKNETESTE
jgi:large subunit ribosomal protein L31e